MTADRARRLRVTRRWQTERKVSADDVDWLLAQATRAEVMAAAKTLNNHGLTGKEVAESAIADLLRGAS